MTTAIAVDIGGTSTKAAAVDARTGRVLTDRLELPTPRSPVEVASAVRSLVRELGPPGTPIGCALPGRSQEGTMTEVVHLDPTWIGLDPRAVLEESLHAPITVMNDADAVGLAEGRFGVATGSRGSIAVLTLGTGVGSALLHDGRLVSGTELGQLEVEGASADATVSAQVARSEGLDLPSWADRLVPFVQVLHALLALEMVIIGGAGGEAFQGCEGLFRAAPVPIVPAALGNRAGIIGAAIAASGL